MLNINQTCFNIYGFVSLTLLDFEQSLRSYASSDSSQPLEADARVCFANYHDAIYNTPHLANKIFHIYGFIWLTLVDFAPPLRSYALSDSSQLLRVHARVCYTNYHDAIYRLPACTTFTTLFQ